MFAFLLISDAIVVSKIAAFPAGAHWLNGQLIGGNGHLPNCAKWLLIFYFLLDDRILNFCGWRT
jgi:hypothetical protein